MGANDIVLLDSLLQAWKEGGPAGLSDTASFEVFALEQALKDFDLPTEDLVKGRTGGGDDGGIDGFFTFLNGDLLDEDSDLATAGRSPTCRSIWFRPPRGQRSRRKPLIA